MSVWNHAGATDLQTTTTPKSWSHLEYKKLTFMRKPLSHATNFKEKVGLLNSLQHCCIILLRNCNRMGMQKESWRSSLML